MGAALIAAAYLALGIDNELTRELSATDPVTTAIIKSVAAGGINVALALLLGATVPPVVWSAELRIHGGAIVIEQPTVQPFVQRRQGLPIRSDHVHAAIVVGVDSNPAGEVHDVDGE